MAKPDIAMPVWIDLVARASQDGEPGSIGELQIDVPIEVVILGDANENMVDITWGWPGGSFQTALAEGLEEVARHLRGMGDSDVVNNE